LPGRSFVALKPGSYRTRQGRSDARLTSPQSIATVILIRNSCLYIRTRQLTGSILGQAESTTGKAGLMGLDDALQMGAAGFRTVKDPATRDALASSLDLMISTGASSFAGERSKEGRLT
jgi:hypothetical protein